MNKRKGMNYKLTSTFIGLIGLIVTIGCSLRLLNSKVDDDAPSIVFVLALNSTSIRLMICTWNLQMLFDKLVVLIDKHVHQHR